MLINKVCMQKETDIALAIGRSTFFVVQWIYCFRNYRKGLTHQSRQQSYGGNTDDCKRLVTTLLEKEIPCDIIEKGEDITLGIVNILQGAFSSGFECGILLDNNADLQVGDVIESIKMQRI